MHWRLVHYTRDILLLSRTKKYMFSISKDCYTNQATAYSQSFTSTDDIVPIYNALK
jgi:hypothetical protein